MIWLLISIICNTLLFIVLRSYGKFKVNSFAAIIVNYFTAATLGFMYPGSLQDIPHLHSQDWFIYALFTGALFISVFLLVSRAANELGIASASVANKMSFIMPVLLGFFLFNESLGWLRILGFVLAIISVIMVSVKKEDGVKSRRAGLVLGILVFIGSGMVDTAISFMQNTFFMDGGSVPYIALSFLSAGTIGAAFLVIKRNEPGKKEIIGGILLGVPNFISIVCMMAALEEKMVDSGVLFAISNLSVVIFSTLSSIVLFRERLSWLNWIGIAVATAAIAIVTFYPSL